MRHTRSSSRQVQGFTTNICFFQRKLLKKLNICSEGRHCRGAPLWHGGNTLTGLKRQNTSFECMSFLAWPLLDPSQWKTSLVDLKEKLLDMLDDEAKVDVVPCHGDGVVSYDHVYQWRHHNGKRHHENFNQLWIGRSCFVKRSSSTTPSTPDVSSCFAMEDASTGTGGGVGRVRDSNPSKVDGAGAPTDCGGAT